MLDKRITTETPAKICKNYIRGDSIICCIVISRFKREEAKIQAWENHEKAKAEAEMRRVEVKVERMRSHANEKLMNKLAAARRRAEELRAKAEALRCEQAAKTATRSEDIRRTGKVPTSFFGHLCG